MALVGPRCNGCGNLPNLAGITIGAPYDTWWCVNCFSANKHKQPQYQKPLPANGPYAIRFEPTHQQLHRHYPAGTTDKRLYTTSRGPLDPSDHSNDSRELLVPHRETEPMDISITPMTQGATFRRAPPLPLKREADYLTNVVTAQVRSGPKIAEYNVGWICAIEVEYVVACEMLDREFDPPSGLSSRDDNVYACGRIGFHNVVIACLPKGKYGTTSAASVATNMLRSFSGLRNGIHLMVGIGGGAPTPKNDIRLGDVVVSSPYKRTGGVIHYKFGKAIQNQEFERTGSLNSPPPLLLNAISLLSTDHVRHGHKINKTVNDMIERNPRLQERFAKPDASTDVLYKSDYVHRHPDGKCSTSCYLEGYFVDNKVERKARTKPEDDPVIHYGLIASADQLMKDAGARDVLAKNEGVLCFEMEAAGLMDNFHCLVIRGICDYSDTHKNDAWQGYAATTAAAYAKELLAKIPPPNVTRTRIE